MTKSEYEGIAFTSAMTPEGWQISVTERAESSVTAYANLMSTINVMVEDGLVPFVTSYNRANENIYHAEEVQETQNVLQPTSVVEEAQGLGGVVKLQGTLLDDGTYYLGIKTRRPKVSECLEGNSYEIVVNRYERDGSKLMFYNEHSEYPACTHNLKGPGLEVFRKCFPNWEPADGTSGSINPVKLYIVGEGRTSKGNAWQNLRSVSPA